LNTIYCDNSSLWSLDNSSDGFEWITAGEHSGAVFIFVRRGRKHSNLVIVASNLTPTLYEDFRFGTPVPGDYEECLNTNSSYYGGTDHGNLGKVSTENIDSHGRLHSLNLTLPPLATIVLKKVAE